MASKNAVGLALSTLIETFPTREITAQTANVWMGVLSETNDDALGRAVLRLCRDPQRKFFPTSGELFAEIQTEVVKAVIDVEQIQRRISALGSYNPNMGWMYPSAAVVRQELGDAVADAYSACGGAKLFSDDDVGRSIAEREFRKEIDVQQTQGKLTAIGAGSQKQLTGANE